MIIYIILKKKPEINSKVSGKVTDAETGDALEDARIDIRNNDDGFHIHSDKNGNYKVEIRKGKYIFHKSYGVVGR